MIEVRRGDGMSDDEELTDIFDEEELAEWFHKEYEKASLAYGWNTQKDCQVDFWKLPKANRNTMIAVMIRLRLMLSKGVAKKWAEGYDEGKVKATARIVGLIEAKKKMYSETGGLIYVLNAILKEIESKK